MTSFATATAQDWGMGAANAKLSQPDIFAPLSTPAHDISTVAWFTLGVSGAIFVVVAGLLVYAIVKFRARPGDDQHEPPQVYGSNPIELAWTVIPILIVVVLFLTTVRTIFTVQAAPEPPGAIHVRVIAHQWWWEFRYPDLGIVTANELHIPVSDPSHPTPTFMTLESADVAHSFWVPQLAGKTDVIPNRINQMWMAPQKPGIYLGRCAEFCGAQHALMLLRVVVQPHEQWEEWVAEQQRPPAWDPAAQRGRQIFDSSACVNCHTIRGTVAEGSFGPDLTHLMSRETIGSGAALNTPQNLEVWIEDPARIKPGVLMPSMNLSSQDFAALAKYLESLH